MDGCLNIAIQSHGRTKYKTTPIKEIIVSD